MYFKGNITLTLGDGKEANQNKSVLVSLLDVILDIPN